MAHPALQSDLEWRIMKYLWKQERASIREIWEALFPEGDKAYTTIQTYMERMVDKSLLTKEKIGLVNFYSPRHSEQEALSQAASSFVDKAFEGSFLTLANFLIKSDKLKHDDLEELRRLLQSRERDAK